MNNKQKVIKKLKGIKKFRISWIDEVEKSVEIEAKDEDEASNLFKIWDFDDTKIEEGDINLNDNSIEIEEIEDE